MYGSTGIKLVGCFLCPVNAVNGQGYRDRKSLGGKYIELGFYQKYFFLSLFISEMGLTNLPLPVLGCIDSL